MRPADGIEHVLQDPAQAAVLFILHRLQVDLIAAQVGAQVLQHFWGSVAVGDVDAFHPCLHGLAEDGHGPFAGDERLVVRRSHDPCPGPFARRHDLLRAGAANVADRLVGLRIAQHLGGEPVLTESAVKIAAQHAKGEGVCARQEVIERLLFDRVGLQASHVTPRNAQLAALVKAYLADAAPPILHQAAVGAGCAAHGIVFQLLCQLSGHGHFIE